MKNKSAHAERLPHPRPPRDRGTGAAQSKPRAARWLAPHPLCSPPRPQCPPGAPGPAPPAPTPSATRARRRERGRPPPARAPRRAHRPAQGRRRPPSQGPLAPSRSRTQRPRQPDSPLHCAQRKKARRPHFRPVPRLGPDALGFRSLAGRRRRRSFRYAASRPGPAGFRPVSSSSPKRGGGCSPRAARSRRGAPAPPPPAPLHRWALPPRRPGFLVAVDVCLARLTPRPVNVLPCYGFLVVKGTFHDVFPRIPPNKMN